MSSTSRIVTPGRPTSDRQRVQIGSGFTGALHSVGVRYLQIGGSPLNSQGPQTPLHSEEPDYDPYGNPITQSGGAPNIGGLAAIVGSYSETDTTVWQQNDPITANALRIAWDSLLPGVGLALGLNSAMGVKNFVNHRIAPAVIGGRKLVK